MVPIYGCQCHLTFYPGFEQTAQLELNDRGVWGELRVLELLVRQPRPLSHEDAPLVGAARDLPRAANRRAKL